MVWVSNQYINKLNIELLANLFLRLMGVLAVNNLLTFPKAIVWLYQNTHDYSASHLLCATPVSCCQTLKVFKRFDLIQCSNGFFLSQFLLPLFCQHSSSFKILSMFFIYYSLYLVCPFLTQQLQLDNLHILLFLPSPLLLQHSLYPPKPPPLVFLIYVEQCCWWHATS